MYPMQAEFYNLLQRHANWWHQAGYLTSRHLPTAGNFVPGELPQSFIDQAGYYKGLASRIQTLSPLQFQVWVRDHRETYHYLYSSLTLFYARIDRAS